MDLQAVLTHLAEVDCTDLVPFTLQIGSQRYGAIAYRQECEVSEGCRAYQEGQRVYTRAALYVLGALPPSYVRSSRTVYQFDDSGVDWYIGSYYTGAPNAWHPAGAMFLMAPWQVPDGGPIDRWQPRPYRRLPACAS